MVWSLVLLPNRPWGIHEYWPDCCWYDGRTTADSRTSETANIRQVAAALDDDADDDEDAIVWSRDGRRETEKKIVTRMADVCTTFIRDENSCITLDAWKCASRLWSCNQNVMFVVVVVLNSRSWRPMPVAGAAGGPVCVGRESSMDACDARPGVHGTSGGATCRWCCGWQREMQVPLNIVNHVDLIDEQPFIGYQLARQFIGRLFWLAMKNLRWSNHGQHLLTASVFGTV